MFLYLLFYVYLYIKKSWAAGILVLPLTCFSFRIPVISHDLQKRTVDKEQEKQKILEDTKELTEKNIKISKETEEKNQELKNVEK